MKKNFSTIKLGISCPSEIFAESSPKGVLVTYYPTHYGHGEKMGIARVFPAEKAAVDELVSKGFSFGKLMKDLKGGEIIDNTLLHPLRRRYLKWVKQVFQTPMYHAYLSDGECISQWVQKSCSMDECPILLCELGNMECSKEQFILVIMTEFQKQILMSNAKELICVDVRRVFKKSLIVISVIDELHRSFPVVYCLCNNLNKNKMTQIFVSIRDHTGELRPHFLISYMQSFIYEAWVDVMGYSPLWLWTHWSIRKVIRSKLLHSAKKHIKERCEVFDTMKTIIDCKNKDVFNCMYENLVNKLQNNTIFEKFKVWLEKTFGSSCEKWAGCWRKDISYMTSLHLESLYHSIDIACTKSMEQKNLFRLIHVLMKILRNKMMDRILDSFDEDKIKLALHAIDLCHENSMNIPEENVTSMGDKIWSIKNDDDDEKEFVTLETATCPDHCVLKCKMCNICVHMYSCSCINNIINSNLCRHIHAVAYKISKQQPPSCESESMGGANEILLDDFPLLKRHVDNFSTEEIISSESSSQNIESTETCHSPENLHDSEESPQFEANFSTNLLGKIDSKQVVLKKITELYQIVKNYNFTETKMKELAKHLNVCHKIATHKKSDYSVKKTPASIPINAVYVIKPKNSANAEVEKKRSIKRIRFPSVEERYANVKRFKLNISAQPKKSSKEVMKTLLSDQRLEVKKLTKSPIMLVLSKKAKT